MTARNPLKRPFEGDEKDQNGLESEEAVCKKQCLEPCSRPAVTLSKPAPLAHELPPLPVRPRGKRFTYEEALKGTDEPVRVYADGIFDLYHNGHARVFMQAKNAFPNTYLIVGITSDDQTHRLKGKTVLTEEERYDSVRHCRYVDEVITDAPWVITEEFLNEHQIDFVAHDDLPYNAADIDDVYKHIKEMGRFVATQRTQGISTSDVIARIVKDYDLYLRRNLARGYSAKDLNVGYIKEKELVWRKRMSHLKHGVGEKSRDLVAGFLTLFGRDGRISEFFHDQKEKIKRVFSPSSMETRHLLGSTGSDSDESHEDTGARGGSSEPLDTSVNNAPGSHDRSHDKQDADF